VNPVVHAIHMDSDSVLCYFGKKKFSGPWLQLIFAWKHEIGAIITSHWSYYD